MAISFIALIALVLILGIGMAAVVGLITALGGRGRAAASALVSLGLLFFFFMLAGLFVSFYERVGTAPVALERQQVEAERALVQALAEQRARAGSIDLSEKAAHTEADEKPAAETETEAEAEKADDAAETDEDKPPKPEKPAEEPATDVNRPEWVDVKPFKEDGAFKVPVTVGPWPNSHESMKRLPDAVDKEIAKYAAGRINTGGGARVQLPRDFIMSHMIAKDVWEESVKIESFDEVKHMVGRDVWDNSTDAADGDWTRLHVLLKFDDEVNRRLDEGWARIVRIERLQSVGGLGAIVMIFLAAVYSYLKIDLKTKGAYRGRLRAGAVAAILALIALVILNQA